MFDKMIYVFDPYEDFPWEKALRESYEDGVRVASFLTALPLCWQEDGGFDFSLLDELQDRILEIAPDMQLLPRVFMTTPHWWDERHPDQLLRFDGVVPGEKKFSREHQKLWKYESKMYHSCKNPSVASPLWRQDAGDALEAYVRHLVDRYGCEKIAAIQIAYGTCGEWGQFGSYVTGQFGNGDFSLPMVQAFRDFLRHKYGENADTAAALPPTKLERMQVQFGNLRSPDSIRKTLDYFDSLAQEQAKSIASFCRRVKKVDPQIPTGCFGGGIFSPGSSCYMLHMLIAPRMEKLLLAIDELDFLSTPNCYFNRLRGIFSQTAIQAITRKKHFIAECDVRTHYATDPYAPGQAQDLSQFLMEVGFNLGSGKGKFWLYDFGKNWYRDPAIRHAIGQINKIYGQYSIRQAQVAVVADLASTDCSEGGMGYYRQFAQFLYNELPRAGVGADYITTNDIFELPPYRLYIFRDLFLTDRKQAEKLRKFLEKNKSSAIFFGAAGCISNSAVDFTHSKTLTSFEIKAVPHAAGSNSVTFFTTEETSWLTQNIPLPFTLCGVEDLNSVYSPLLTTDDGQVAGVVESTGLPGLVIHAHPDRVDLWTPSPIVPARLLRNLYQRIGLTPLADHASIYGAGPLYVLRSDIPQTIKLPIELFNIITETTYPPDSEINLEAGETLLLMDQKNTP